MKRFLIVANVILLACLLMGQLTDSEGRWMLDGVGGKLVQRVYAETTSTPSTDSDIPDDTSIPQSDEGAELFSQAITPTDAANRLRVTARVNIIVTDDAAVIALFRDAGSNAIDVAFFWGSSGVSGNGGTITLVYEVVAGSTASTTFKLRYGPANSVETAYINGNGANMFGSADRSTFIIEEITP